MCSRLLCSANGTTGGGGREQSAVCKAMPGLQFWQFSITIANFKSCKYLYGAFLYIRNAKLVVVIF